MYLRFLFLIISFISFFGYSQEESLKPNIDSIPVAKVNQESIKKAPVVYKKDTLFFITNINGEYPAYVRAQAINKKLKDLEENFNPLLDSIFNKKQDSYYATVKNNKVLFITSTKDALEVNVPLEILATNRLQKLKKSVHTKPEITLQESLINIGFFIVSLLVLIGFVKLVNFLFRRLNKRLSKIEKKFLKKNGYIVKYFIPKDTANIFVFIANIVRIIILILVFLLYSPFMFSFFPRAEHVVELFYNYISSPVMYIVNGFIDFIPSLFFIIIITMFARYIVRVGKEIAVDIDNEKLQFDNFHKDWAMPTAKIFSAIIYALALILIFPYIPGSGSAAFQGISIFIGAIISFGSTSAISNIIAGIVITYMRPFQVGDRVKINDIVGDVVDKTILVTHINTYKNEDVTIPNANILLGNITNYSNNEENKIILHTTITLGYDLPWQTAEKLLLAAANNTALIDKTPAPFVLQKSLDDYYVSYELNAYTTHYKKMPLIYSEIHKNILDIFNDAGVEILSPAYMSARDGSLSTVPSQLKPEDKSPLTKIVDHLTGRNQEVKITKNKEEGEY